MVSFLAESASWVGELEGPQEVSCLLEVLSDGVDLVDQIFSTNNVVLAKLLFNDGIVGDSDTLSVDLGISTLVDEVADGLQARVSPGNVRVDNTEHLDSGLVQLDEDTIIDLSQTEKLKNLAGTRVDLVDTTNTDNEGESGFVGNVVVSGLLGVNTELLLLVFLVLVLSDVLLSTLVDLRLSSLVDL